MLRLGNTMDDTETKQANCPPESIASVFRMLAEVAAEEQALLQKRDNLMRMMAEVAGTTFMYEGQIFQVCERFNKARGKDVPFFKKLAAWPKSWLDKTARAQRGLDPEPFSTEAEDELTQVDVGVSIPSSDPMLLNTVDTQLVGVSAAVVID